MKALARAADRDVKISMLLEASNARGGNLSFDAFGKMKAALPTACMFFLGGQDERVRGGKRSREDRRFSTGTSKRW